MLTSDFPGKVAHAFEVACCLATWVSRVELNREVSKFSD